MPHQDQRLLDLSAWLDQQLPEVFARCGWGEVPVAQLTAASSDASFRRYFRWQADDRSLIVMDAPPPREDCRPFVKVAQMLDDAGVHVPRILAADLERGFLLLTDLGRQTYLDVIDASNADQLFDDAIEALLKFQLHPVAQPMPAYDEALLRRELQLFPSGMCSAILAIPSLKQQAAWERVCRQLIDSALAQPQVLVHRDYMPRNLMISEPNRGAGFSGCRARPGQL